MSRSARDKNATPVSFSGFAWLPMASPMNWLVKFGIYEKLSCYRGCAMLRVVENFAKLLLKTMWNYTADQGVSSY